MKFIVEVEHPPGNLVYSRTFASGTFADAADLAASHAESVRTTQHPDARVIVRREHEGWPDAAA